LTRAIVDTRKWRRKRTHWRTCAQHHGCRQGKFDGNQRFQLLIERLGQVRCHPVQEGTLVKASVQLLLVAREQCKAVLVGDILVRCSCWC